MKKLFEEDLKFNDLKSILNNSKHKNKSNPLIVILVTIGVIALIGGIVFAICKFFRKSYEFDFDDYDDDDFDDDFDEPDDGYYFTSDDDFDK